jgi:hypothetical protein
MAEKAVVLREIIRRYRKQFAQAQGSETTKWRKRAL